MDKSTFLARRKPRTREVGTEVGTLIVRALTRDEVKALDKHKDSDDHDLRIIHAGITDPAGLNLDEVKEWASAVPVSEYLDVLRAINELSGVGEGAAKSGLPGAG